jgi:hypothetical protein
VCVCERVAVASEKRIRRNSRTTSSLYRYGIAIF